MTTHIAILGDFNPEYATHHALNDSIRQIVKRSDEELQFDWIGTDIFDFKRSFAKLYSGLWIAPGSPYRNMQNVLNAIRYTRENNIPTLGNCGGFQHMIIEFARNVCEIYQANHEETNPDADDLVISKLSCSLIEAEENLTITDSSSKLFQILRQKKLQGKYFCSYGINKTYEDILRKNGLSMTALSPDNQIRAIELKSHSFFIGTLFQPALTSTPEQPNPIIISFINACCSKYLVGRVKTEGNK